MSGTLSREDTLRRAAELRVKIISVLNVAGKPVSLRHLQENLKDWLHSSGYPDNFVLQNFLYAMVKNELIAKHGVGTVATYSKIGVVPVEQSLRSESAHKAKKKESKPPSIKVDIVKATGKVRISIDSITIEIGVI